MKNRLLLVASVLMLLCVAPSVAAQSASPLEVSDPHWRYLAAREETNFPTHYFFGGAPVGFSTISVVTHAVSALFRNAGSKTVKAVTWEYIFFKDEQQTQVQKRYKFRRKHEIRPGEATRLRKFSYKPRYSQYETARVLRVDYADGTSWQANK